jgi:chromosome segregation ATPase
VYYYLFILFCSSEKSQELSSENRRFAALIMDSEHRHKNLKSEVDLLNTEIQTLRLQQLEKDRLLSAYNQLEHRIANSLQEKDSQNIALANQLLQEVEAKDAVSSKLNDELRDKAILAKKLSGEENLIAALSSSLSASEENRHILVTRITDSENLLEAEKKASASLKSSLDMEQQNRVELKRRFDEKENELTALNNSLHEIEESNATLSAELRVQKANYSELENSSNKESLKKAYLQNRVSEVEAENVQLLNKLHDNESAIHALKHEIHQVVVEKTDILLKLRATESENLILMENLATLEDEELALKHEGKSAAAAITNRLLLAEEKVNHLINRVQEEQNKFVLFAQKNADQEILLMNKISDQEDDIRVLSSNVATLTSEKIATTNRIEQCEVRLRDKEKEKQLLLKTVREFEMKYADLQQSMKQKVADNSDLERDCHNLRSQLAELSVSNMDKIGSAVSVVADLRLMLSQKDNQLSNLSSEVRSLQADKVHLERQLSDTTIERDKNSKNLKEVQRILELVEKENHSLKEIKRFLEASLRNETGAIAEKTQAMDKISVQLADMKVSRQEMKDNLQVKERELTEAQQKLSEMVNLLTTNIDEMKALYNEKHFLMVDMEKTQEQAAELARLLSVANAEVVSLRDSNNLVAEKENGRFHEVTQLISPVSSNYPPPSNLHMDRVEQIVIATKGSWQEETKTVQEEFDKRNTHEVSINDRYIDASPVRFGHRVVWLHCSMI